MTATVAEAQARLPDLLAQLPPGETLTLLQDDRPVADLVVRPAPVPQGQRPPNLKLRAALAEALAARPQTPTPVNDDDLREAREGGCMAITGNPTAGA